MSGSEIVRVRVLDRLRSAGRPSAYVDLTPLLDEVQTSEQVIGQVCDALETEGLIQTAYDGGSLIPAAMLTGPGAAEADRRAQRRDDPQQRAFACRDALVCWLQRERLQGNKFPVITGFREQPAYWFEGFPFEEKEVEDATRDLRDRELVAGTGSFGGGIARPTLTHKGVDCAEQHDCSVSAYTRAQQPGGGAQFTTNFNAPVSGQVGIGQTVHQTQTQGLDMGALLPLLQAVREATADIPETDARYVSTYVDLIQAEAGTDAPNPEAIRHSTERLEQFAGKVGSSTLTATISALVQAVARAIGLGG